MIRALIFASLRRYAGRTMLAMLGIAVATGLLLDMVMLGGGMRASFRRFLLVQGFDVRVSPKGTLPMDTEATIPGAGAILDALRGNSLIASATPVLGLQLFVVRPSGIATSFAVGVDPRTQADYDLVAGRPVENSADLVVNDAFLHRVGARVGDSLDVASGFDPQFRTYRGRRRLVIVGEGRFFYTAADEPVAALPITTAQVMGGAERADRASLFLVKVRQSGTGDSVASWIDRTIPRVSALSTDAALRQVDDRLGYFRQLALILSAVSLAVGFLLVSTLMTVSVNERIGEIAVMRAIGIQRVRVVQQILLESIILTMSGAALGLGLGLITAHYLDRILSDFPGLPARFHFFLFEPASAWRSLAFLAAVGIVAALYPAWRAATLPISATLRREAIA